MKNKLFATFWLADRLYGIDVTQVQEITQPMTFTRVPLAPDFVRGLINLRGQIATLLDLRDLFQLSKKETEQPMFVFCQAGTNLLALKVDQIGDVIETSEENFELSPEVIPPQIRKLMSGVYKEKQQLISILKVESIAGELAGASSLQRNRHHQINEYQGR